MTNLKEIVTRSEEEFGEIANLDPNSLTEAGTEVCDMNIKYDQIREHNRQATIALLEGVVEMVEGKNSKCTCSCEFGDGCLCKQVREGYEQAKSDITTELKTLLADLKKEV